MPESLDVWLYGTRVATVTNGYDGRLALDWGAEALNRWGTGARVLSAKLATGSRVSPALVKNYLDGLLPEGNARVNHAMTAGVPPDDTFALVREYGRDTPGAAIFVPAGSDDPTGEGHYEQLDLDHVAERIRQADEHSAADQHGHTGESSTLPGMVPKITLHRDGDAWYACKDGAPSTWIIKRAHSSESGAVDVIDTEAACLDLARRVGLTTIRAEIFEHDGVRAIAVSRYDRDSGLGRIHQEDLAQAIGLNTADPNRKFQWGAQIPSLRHGADVLRLDGGNPDALLRLATFTYLVGNTDMHAKNVSFLRLDDGSVTLSPAYDIAMHLHHPRVDRRVALDINGTFLVQDITIEDLVAEGRTWGLPERRAASVVNGAARDLADALAAINRDAHPGVSEEAWEVVEGRVHQAADPVTRAIATRGKRRGPRRPS